MAGRLASVPEDSITAPYRPRNSYRELIRSVVWPQWQISSAFSSRSGQSGSTYSSISGASSSYLSNISGCSSRAAGLGAAEELTTIAHRMVSDGYTQRMVRAFRDGGGQDRALEKWFLELDVDWVLEIYGGLGLLQQLQLQDKSASWLQELVQRWTRALTIIVAIINKELVTAARETPAVARFGKASISAMLVFVDAIVHVSKEDKLQAVLQTYICVSGASHDMLMVCAISSEAQRIFKEIGASLDREEKRLVETISKTMMNMRMLLTDDYDNSWAIETPRGGGQVHKNIRFLVDCIVSMRKARASTHNSGQRHNTGGLDDVIRDTIDYVKDLILIKSKLCLDPSLRYIFLINNSYFVAQVDDTSMSLEIELSSGHRQVLKITPECGTYINSYRDVSWGHVMCHIPKLHLPGPFLRWSNKSSLAKFQSVFHKTYQAQKFWKVPDPRLRSVVRELITKRVISGYRDYLKQNPELEKQVSGGSNSPEVMEEMLGELFEG